MKGRLPVATPQVPVTPRIAMTGPRGVLSTVLRREPSFLNDRRWNSHVQKGITILVVTLRPDHHAIGQLDHHMVIQMVTHRDIHPITPMRPAHRRDRLPHHVLKHQ